MKNPAHSFLKSAWSKAAIALTLVLCIASVLWFATPAAAVSITFPSVPASVYYGQIYSFTMKVAVENSDYLPINNVNLQVYSTTTPSTTVTVTGLPIPSGAGQTASRTFSTTGGTFSISGTADSNWGYGYTSSAVGYGYGYQTNTYGYGYQYPSAGYGYGYGYGSNIGPASITYTVSWLPAWGVGTYGVKSIVYGGPGSSYFTNSSAATFNILAQNNVSYGGSTTTTTSPVTGTGTVSVSSVVSSTGVFSQPVTVNSADSLMAINVAQNVTGKNKDGTPLTQISDVAMTTPPAAPASGNVIGLAYNLGPDGATFSPAITLSFTYDPAKLPAGFDPNTLVIAYYDSTANQWVNLTGITVNTTTHVITGQTTHFTPFSVLAVSKPAATTPAVIATTTPAKTTSAVIATTAPVVTTPAVIATTTPAKTTAPAVVATTTAPATSSSTSSSNTNWGLIIGIIVVVIVIIAIVVWMMRRKKPTTKS